MGPVIAAGNGPVWVFSGARAVAMPGNWYGAYYAHTQDRFAGGLLVPVGFSISMSDLLALQVMGDWIWFPGDGTQHLRANVGFAFRGDW